MLTKSDLNQIGNVVGEKLERRLGPIEKRLTSIEGRFTPIAKDIKYLKKKVNRIDKTLDIVVKKYDEGDVNLGRRVQRIETHLGLAPLPQQ